MNDADNTLQRPYKCTIRISLPSNQYAQYLMDVISVDKEISNKVVKYFSVVTGRDHNIDDSSEDGNNNADSDMNVLQM